jgi:hypothetical protein
MDWPSEGAGSFYLAALCSGEVETGCLSGGGHEHLIEGFPRSLLSGRPRRHEEEDVGFSGIYYRFGNIDVDGLDIDSLDFFLHFKLSPGRSVASRA